MKKGGGVAICLALACISLVAGADVVHVRGSDVWKVRDGESVRMTVVVEPKGKGFGDMMKVTAGADGTAFDFREAFAKGASMVRVSTARYENIAELVGKEVLVETTWTCPEGMTAVFCLEGLKQGKHWWNRWLSSKATRLSRFKTLYRVTRELPADVTNLHFRFDISSADGVVTLHSHRIVPADAFDFDAEKPPYAKPSLLYRKDGEIVQATWTSPDPFVLPVRGNLDPVRGTMAFWVTRAWTDPRHETDPVGTKDDFHTVFEAGPMRLEWNDNYLSLVRGDADKTELLCRRMPYVARKRFYVIAWDEWGTDFWCDGEPMPYGRRGDSASALRSALEIPRKLVFDPAAPAPTEVRFGNAADGKRPLEGRIADLRIWNGRMSAADAKALFLEANGGQMPDWNGWDRPFDPAANPLPAVNPYVLKSVEKGGVPGRLELLDRVCFDGLGALGDAEKVRYTGDYVRKELNGTPYLESALQDDKGITPRLAVRFGTDVRHPLHVIEVDYPDDAVRTMDVVAQFARLPPGVKVFPFVMESGIMSGGPEFVQSNAIRTQRFLYWTEQSETALIFRACRGSRLAVAEVRLYRVADGALPEAMVDLPADPDDRRHFGLFYEDPSLETEFVVNQAAPGKLQEHLNRLVAYMKYFGQDLLAYPAAFYNGLICDKYMPRRHAPHFLKEFCRRFDAEGLWMMPTINLENLPFDGIPVTRKSVSDGSLHDTAYCIQADGKPNATGWHGTPPRFNVAHPDTQACVRKIVGQIADECAEYRSFKGVCLHLVAITSLWWGDIDAGYNDYNIVAFERATGVKVPRAEGPLRGRDYAAWLKANAYDAWVAWRCDVVTDFYRTLDAELKARRKDLRLWIIAKPNVKLFAKGLRDWQADDAVTRLLREGGIDAAKLSAAIPDAIFGNMARYGMQRDELPTFKGTEEAKAYVRDILTKPEYYAEMFRGTHPALTMWDTYFESPIGTAKGLNCLSGGWLHEKRWRVAVVNPVGRNALRDYALALRYGDVLHFNKGGFLIGTYGTEEFVTPWMQQFRSLPAVKFEDLPSPAPNVVFRGAMHKGVVYRYLCNTTPEPVIVRVELPGQGVVAVSLDAYELRAYRFK